MNGHARYRPADEVRPETFLHLSHVLSLSVEDVGPRTPRATRSQEQTGLLATMANKMAYMQVGLGNRHLLPHERWLVQNIARRNMPARNRNAARALRDYGPDGAMLWTAATASLPVACLAAVVGFALLLWSGAAGTAGDTGGWLILVALLFGLLVALRVSQCIRAGRVYRANRSNLGR